MSAKTLLTLSASVLLGAAVAAPNAALAQFGPPPGPPPMLAGPPPGLAAGGPPPGLAGGPPLGGRPAGPVAGLPPRGGAGAPPRDIAGGPPRLDGAGGLHGLAAAKPIFAVSRVAPRPTAPTATLAIVLPAMAMAVVTDTGLMRRLTPIVDPMPPPTTAATTCPPIGDTAPGAFWSAKETD
jgi:hypothetical protein